MKKVSFLFLAFIVCIPLVNGKTLTIDECRQLALEHNKTLQIANENLKAAQQLKAAAFTQFFPNFSANAGYTWNQKNISLLSEDALLPVGTKMSDGSFGFNPNQISNQWTQVNGEPVPLDQNGNPFNPKTDPSKIEWKNYALLPKSALEYDIRNVFVGGIGFIQPLFMGGKIRELYHLAGYGEKLAEAQKAQKVSDILINVDEAYWLVISVENKVALAKQYHDLVAKVDSNVQVMIGEGVTTKADGLKVRVKLNEADLALTKAEDGLKLSHMALNQLCGLPLDSTYHLADENLQTVSITPQLIPIEQALANRPEIKVLTQMENMARSNEKITFSRFLPNIALTGNYLVSNPNSYNGYENKFGGMFTVGVVASVPLFHFGDKIHTLSAAKSQLRMARLEKEDAEEKITLQIKQNTYKTVESIKKQITAKHNMEVATENLRCANEGFTSGVLTSTDILEAETAWLSAQSDYIDATIDVKLCNLYLEKALGTLLVPSNHHVQAK
ncbi:MAG: TolC family protein [Microbacter sp.]